MAPSSCPRWEKISWFMGFRDALIMAWKRLGKDVWFLVESVDKKQGVLLGS